MESENKLANMLANITCRENAILDVDCNSLKRLLCTFRKLTDANMLASTTRRENATLDVDCNSLKRLPCTFRKLTDDEKADM